MTGCSEILNFHQSLDAPLQRRLDACRIVLVAPSLAANIGSTVRAMTTMGLSDLVVVAPRDPAFRSHPDAQARAGRAVHRLADVRAVSDLGEALADCQLAVAVSAEGREWGPPPVFPAPMADIVMRGLAEGQVARVAFVFGTERTGLSTEEMAQCQRWLVIPADADYNSLNVSQAVQIVAFSLRQAVLRAARPGGAGNLGAQVAACPATSLRAAFPRDAAVSAAGDRQQDLLSGHDGMGMPSTLVGGGASGVPSRAPLADLVALEGLYQHLARSLVVLGTLDPARPRQLMPRLRQILGRAGLSPDEVNLLRGICRDIERMAAGGEDQAGQGRS